MNTLKTTAVALLLSSGAAFALPDASNMYRALEQQGFTNIQMYQMRNRIRVYAQEGDQTRQLVYDAGTGKLLWDNMDPQRDRTRDQLFLMNQDQMQARDRIHLQNHDLLRLKDQSRDQDRDRTRDPATH
ncbi:MAG: hypothetical protein KGH84_04390 [Paracoccaceae bacterium]|nr:hypothetical protein [Paracoccaceae bacterium]